MSPSLSVMPNFANQMMLMPWAIGQFIMEWGKHERMLASLLATAERKPYQAVRDDLLGCQTSYYEKRLIAVLADAKDVDTRQVLTELLNGHVPLRAVRNELVHGFWAGMNENDEFLLKRKTRKDAETVQSLTAERVVEHFNSLQQLGVLVIDARQRLAEQIRDADEAPRSSS